MGKGKKNKLPDRWLDYSVVGQEIQGIHIVACKVPMNEGIFRNKNLDRELWFTPEKLIDLVPNVGCIIDLTATNRYYDPKIFTEKGIQHVKIWCGGHGSVPNHITVNKFFQATDSFLRSSGKILMVHCTHGLNRTGYLVSRYLIERRGFEPEDAINAFNQARGHNIERENYLLSLRGLTRRVCRNPAPLFNGMDLRPGHQVQAARYGRGSGRGGRGGRAGRGGRGPTAGNVDNVHGP
ncbi:hypothetical protein DAPPUDRAFT_326892 [Daphnia pulex]|uniref:Uncharacterized protein n=1 Tax=Daphnia pulex TaxID=6669 RepID=E9H937_DAPPU|nr:hypothetical protein DAPPUDRAFT_326892 [Daphnia pulex]|eukprot:EFX71763.1 hypothetical protein DAPPUDRAFT_326892 [Daphnia pulex]